MKEKLYTGYKLEEVERLAVKELGVPKEDMYFDEISETEINVIVDANPVKKGKDFLESFLKNANILGFVERKMRDNVVEFSITTEDANAVLIGKNSKTLLALQYATSLVVNRYFDLDKESGLIVKVDVGDYRKKRDENLEKLAVRVAKEVARTKIPVKLRAMNVYERKVIHTKLADWKNVSTHSEGVDPNRCLIIEPKK